MIASQGTVTGLDCRTRQICSGVALEVVGPRLKKFVFVAVLDHGVEHEVMLPRAELAEVTVFRFSSYVSEGFLWRVVELDHEGLGAHAFAELERRELVGAR